VKVLGNLTLLYLISALLYGPQFDKQASFNSNRMFSPGGTRSMQMNVTRVHDMRHRKDPSFLIVGAESQCLLESIILTLSTRNAVGSR
jgi:hypothetical protein